MASQGERRVIAAPVLVDCVIKTFMVGASKSLTGLCERVQRRNNLAFKQWQRLEDKQIAALNHRIKEFDRRTFANDPHHSAVYTSLLLGLIDDALTHVKKDRKVALHDLLVSLKGLHRHYDRRMDLFSDYAKAGLYLAVWDGIRF